MDRHAAVPDPHQPARRRRAGIFHRLMHAGPAGFVLACLGLVGLGLPCAGLADAVESARWQWRITHENDALLARDRDYTSGFRLEALRTLSHPGQGFFVTVNHQMFTPSQNEAAGPVTNERPYAAWMGLGVGHAWRHQSRLLNVEAVLGRVGPDARGEWLQSRVHQLTAGERFHGWAHQLGNETTLQWLATGWWKHAAPWLGGHADWIASLGLAAGRPRQHLDVALEMRWSPQTLPDDFGSRARPPSGALPQVPGVAPGGMPASDATWRWHVFAALDHRWVDHDLFLDGNGNRPSLSIAKASRLTGGSLGLGIDWQGLRLRFAQHVRSSEYAGQFSAPLYQSFSVAWNW